MSERWGGGGITVRVPKNVTPGQILKKFMRLFVKSPPSDRLRSLLPKISYLKISNVYQTIKQ